MEPGDFSIIKRDDELDELQIEVPVPEAAQKLIAAHLNGAHLCYDGDPSIEMDEDGYGYPYLEIIWAVLYRGGLAEDGLVRRATGA